MRTGLPREQCHVHTTFLGGGFGRRLGHDFIDEAVNVAQHLKTPVKVTWSREDTQENGFYRPMTTCFLKGAIDERGQPVAWFNREISQSILASLIPSMGAASLPEWLPRRLVNFLGSSTRALFENNWIADPTSVEGAADLAYQFQGQRMEYVNKTPPVPVGFWRSVGNSENGFIVESFIDELAHLAQKDPFAFRRDLLPKGSQRRAVLENAAQMAGWGTRKLAPGHALGIAQVHSFGTSVAQVAEVSVKGGQLRVHRVFIAANCGTVVNPDIVRGQLVGAMVFGLSAALRQEITLVDGVVQQKNFNTYDALRMQEMPQVEVHLFPSDAPPQGIGEPGLPPIAPAVTNAIFAATGQRIRRLPLLPQLATS